jgi:hypothetical protein
MVFNDENSYSALLPLISLQSINQIDSVQSIFPNSKHVKLDGMPALKLKQLQYERDTWKRLLDFMMDENVQFKNRLSEILKDKFDKELLEEVEGFQSSFIKEDELIGLLRNELAELDKLLVAEVIEDGKIIEKIDVKLKNLRDNIITAEVHYCKLKVAFNSYLAQNI